MQYSLYGNCDHKLVCSMQILSQYSNTKLNISPLLLFHIQPKSTSGNSSEEIEMITKNIRTMILSYSAISGSSKYSQMEKILTHVIIEQHGIDNPLPIFTRMLHRSHLNKGRLTMLFFEKFSFDI